MSTNDSSNTPRFISSAWNQNRILSRGLGLLILFLIVTLQGAQPPTLMTLVMKWRYPDASFRDASLSDGATVDAQGKRTVPSSVYECEFLTRDSVSDVLKFYQTLLTDMKPGHEVESLEPAGGRSVVVLDGGKDRDFEMKIILVNEDKSSTTLVVSRAVPEAQTHIMWSHYSRL